MSLDTTFEIDKNIHCLRVAPSDQFCYNSFLIVDEHPTLIHTGRAKYFIRTLALASQIIDAKRLKYISFSHFEADECGALNEWLNAAPNSVTLVGPIGKPSIDDIAIRPPSCVSDGEFIPLGNLNLQLFETPHFPHGWDACLLYEPKNQILFSSDFGAQPGVGEPITTRDISDEILDFQDDYGFLSEGSDFSRAMNRVSQLKIRTLATQHGSLLRDSSVVALFEKMRISANRAVNNRIKINCGDFS